MIPPIRRLTAIITREEERESRRHGRALNWADLVAVMTLIMCAATAGLVAASEKAGWFTAIFVVAGLAMGYGSAVGVGKLAYWLLAAAARQSDQSRGCALLLLYAAVPMLTMACAATIAGGLAYLLADRLF
jgi:NADH:ubiquinone oxidoreductase subunit 2 (subunit N)